ncbi:MAG: NAD(P)/FAD-dependent oxidoreductase [Myxococcota bacterium]
MSSAIQAGTYESSASERANERGEGPRVGPRPAVALDHQVVIVGSGFSGLGAAIALSKLGIEDFVILEREKAFGGTWVQHAYPGLEIDMPFFVYSYPFEPRWSWSQLYPTGEEYADYTRFVAKKYDLERRIRCEAGVAEARWDDDAGVWRVRLERGETLVCRWLVSATGLLVVPKRPDIEGIEAFEGKLIHTARWDHDYDLTEKRVAVIGTGATSIQVVPAIADRVELIDVYQRTPIWLMPKPNPRLSPGFQQFLRRVPFAQRLARWAMNALVEVVFGLGFIRYVRYPGIFRWIERRLVAFIRREIIDEELQEKLIPDYAYFCKRPSFSNRFYATLNLPHVELVTDPIERVTKRGIVTTDGRERDVDVIVCATGYQVFNRSCVPGYALIGRGGKDLGAYWEENRYQAYEGITVPDFPNLFLFMGPYSTAGLSYFTMIDVESKHMTRLLRAARRRGSEYVEIKRAAHERDFAKVDRRAKQTVFAGNNCAGSNTYYVDGHGDSPGLRPVTGFEHWLNSRFFPLDDYVFEPPARSGDAGTPSA